MGGGGIRQTLSLFFFHFLRRETKAWGPGGGRRKNKRGRTDGGEEFSFLFFSGNEGDFQTSGFPLAAAIFFFAKCISLLLGCSGVRGGPGPNAEKKLPLAWLGHGALLGEGAKWGFSLSPTLHRHRSIPL